MQAELENVLRLALAGIAWVAGGATAEAQVPTQINVEIDYMVQVAGHSHLPSQNVIDSLVQMFACHGIVLNLMISDAIPHIQTIQCDDPGNDPFWTCNSAASYATLKSLYSDTAGMSGWHYCIIGHDYDSGAGTGSSGRSDGIDDFIVTLGSFTFGTGTDYEIAGTFAHELGHDLGLGHSSALSTNTTGNFAPNYASVMSYQYQLEGVRNKMECLGVAAGPHLYKDLDYSNGRMPTVSEGALFETVGLGIHELDWDCDGTLDPLVVIKDLDTNRSWCDSAAPVPIGLLSDYDDWANLDDKTFSKGDFGGEDVLLSDYDCITFVQAHAIDPASGEPDSFPDPLTCKFMNPPVLTPEPCIGGQMVWADPSSLSPKPNGTGSMPFPDVSSAVGAAPSGSVLFLQPGTFASEPGPVVISTPMILAGPGGAVVAP